MRKNIVAGNWKMNKNFQEAEALMRQLAEYKKNNKTNCEVYIAPPSLYLTTAKNIFANDEVKVFSQDTVRIEGLGRSLMGSHFEASQNFQQYTFYNNVGQMDVTEENSEE